MQARSVEGLGCGVEMSGNDVCGGNVVGVGVWVAEEVGEGYGFEGVGVVEGGFVEFDHSCD